MKFKFLLPALFILAACAPSDKYPMPLQFITADSVAIDALGAPPKSGSQEWENEIQSIVKRQAALTDGQKATLHMEDHISPSMIVLPVLGSGYSEANYPQLYELLKRSASDAWRTGDAQQDYWQSPRPWVADKRVQLLVPSITRPGYPSGHTTTNTVWAYILSDLFPAKRTAFFARAYEIGYHRIDGGAHFPHDVEAGKRLAGMIYKKMRENSDYKVAFKAAKEEISDVASPIVFGTVGNCNDDCSTATRMH